MGNPKGDFIWYELLTSDADAAQRDELNTVFRFSLHAGDPQGAAFGLVGPRVARR